MDQIKIGKFICLKRKKIGITQSELAEKLGITDRLFQNGKMVFVYLMLELCQSYAIFLKLL